MFMKSLLGKNGDKHLWQETALAELKAKTLHPLVTPEGIQSFIVRGFLDPVGPAKLYSGTIALLIM